jgi:pyruvate,water dikinase
MRNQPQLLVNLSVPKRAAAAAAAGAQGVGLLRAEFLVYQTGRHPNLLLEDTGAGSLKDILKRGMSEVASAFHPMPVLYRSLDLRSNELQSLIGGERFESREENPSLGLRGLARSMRDVAIFRTELEAIAEVRAEGRTGLHLMLPFVRWPEEVEWARGLASNAELRHEDGFELWMMVETPAAVLLAEVFAPLIDGVSLGTNDLTQLVLGIDRESPIFARRNLDTDPAVRRAIQWAVYAYRDLGVRTSVCGDAPSRSEEVLRDLCDWGVDSISVSPGQLAATREFMTALTGRERSALQLPQPK